MRRRCGASCSSPRGARCDPRAASPARSPSRRSSPPCGPGVQALGFQVLRWLGRAEALRRQLAKRTPPPAADALLCTALALAWDAERAPYEPFTLVDQAVEAAKRDPATRAQASFINACLRRFLRERDELVAATDREPVAQWNHPRWWIERLQARPSARLAARAGGRQHAGADDAARQRAQDRRARLPARAGGRADLPAHAGGRQRRCSWSGRGRCRQLPGLRRGRVLGAGRRRAAGRAAAARRPARAGQRRRCGCSTPAPRRAARPPTCSNCAGDGRSRCTALEVDAARSRRIDETLARLGLQAEVRRGRRRRARRSGGTASPSTPSCSTRPAPPRASCGAIRTCAGCAARATSSSWPLQQAHAAGGPVAAGASRAAACSIAPARCSATRARTRSMRFLRTTPTPVCGPRRAICCPKAGGMPVASRTIRWVITTASSTPCSKSSRAEAGRPGLRLARALLLLVLLLALAAGAGAGAGPPAPRSRSCRLERGDDGVYLSAAVQFELPHAGRGGARQGHRRSTSWPRPRSTASAGTGPTSSVAQVARHMRLAYQPLTRRWRLNVSPVPISNAGFGVSLNQNFDTLEDALDAVQRVGRAARSATPPRSATMPSHPVDVPLPARHLAAAAALPDRRGRPVRLEHRRSSAAQRLPLEKAQVSTASRAGAGAPPAPAARCAAAVRWAIGVGAALVTAIGLVLMFLLAQATNNRELYERNYAPPVRHQRGGRGAAAAGASAGSRSACSRRLRQGKFGSRLLIKLAAIFALVGVVPGVLIYVVSYQFVVALDRELVRRQGRRRARRRPQPRPRHARLAVRRPGQQDARAPARQLADVPGRQRRPGARAHPRAARRHRRGALERQRPADRQRRRLALPAQPRAADAAAAAPGARASARSRTSKGLDETPAPGADAAAAPASRRWRWCSGRASTSAPSRASCRSRMPLPPALVANALAVQEANREYQERALAREGPAAHVHRHAHAEPVPGGVRRGAAGGAVRQPARAARCWCWPTACARWPAATCGPPPVLQGKDELGGLTRSFAVMTQQLADARGAVEKTMGELDAARANLQTILDNLTSGVIVLDAQGTHRCRPTPAPRACCARRWPPTRASRWPTCRGWTDFGAERAAAVRRVRGRARCSTGSTTGSTPSSCTPAAPAGARTTDQHRGARRRAARATRACWCSTTSPRSSRPSAPRPGARWRAAWRTRSRTR